VFGRLAGAALDVLSAVRKAQPAERGAPGAPAAPTVPPKPIEPALQRVVVVSWEAGPLLVHMTEAPPFALKAPGGGKPVTPPVPAAAGAEEAAGVGGGALAGLAGAAGVAGAVVAAVGALRDAAVGATRAVGEFANRLIDPSADPSRYVELIGNSARQVGEKLTYLSPVLGIFTSVVGQAIESLGSIMRSVDAQVEKFAQYDPGLALAQAQAEVRQTLAEMRRAREGGPALTQYLRERTELQQKFEDAKLRFLMQILPLVIRGMEAVEKLLPLLEATGKGVTFVAEHWDWAANLGPVPAMIVAAIKAWWNNEQVKAEPPRSEDLDPTGAILREKIPDVFVPGWLGTNIEVPRR
jgi:hypothetical protein